MDGWIRRRKVRNVSVWTDELADRLELLNVSDEKVGSDEKRKLAYVNSKMRKFEKGDLVLASTPCLIGKPE